MVPIHENEIKRRESGKLLMGKSAWDIEGHWTQMYTTEFNTLGGTLFAAFLNAAFNFCLGCEMYLLIKRFTPAARAS